MSEVLARLTHVSKRFGVVQALDRVSLEVRRSEVLALVGESGSGKTVLAELIAGLQRPTSGTVEVRGRAQMIFQDPYESLDPRLPTLSSVAEPLRSYRPEARQAALSALAGVGLEPARYAPRFPHELSGGELQRVSVARAIVARPDLLVADEPTTMLDVSVRAALLRLLHRLRHEYGLAILLISHDFSGVRAIADRVVVLYRGRVVETGPCAAVLRRPRHPYTAALIAAVPQPDPDTPLRRLAAVEDLARATFGCPFAPRCPERQPVCTQTIPELVSLGSGQYSACLLAQPAMPETGAQRAVGGRDEG